MEFSNFDLTHIQGVWEHSYEYAVWEGGGSIITPTLSQPSYFYWGQIWRLPGDYEAKLLGSPLIVEWLRLQTHIECFPDIYKVFEIIHKLCVGGRIHNHTINIATTVFRIWQKSWSCTWATCGLIVIVECLRPQNQNHHCWKHSYSYMLSMGSRIHHHANIATIIVGTDLWIFGKILHGFTPGPGDQD